MPKKGELKPIPHDTYAGYRAHIRRNEPMDECGCRQAERDYQADQRKKLRRLRDKNRFNEKVRNMVASQLMRRHPSETRELIISAKRLVRAEMLRENKRGTPDV